jgi:sec-independent protein translocase protein TatA
MNTMLAIFGLGGGEVVLILGAVLILFGAKKIPEFAKGMGQGIKEFKKATREVSEEIHSSMDETPAPPQRKLPPAQVVSTDIDVVQPTASQTAPGQKA